MYLAIRQQQTTPLVKTCLTLQGKMGILVSKINKYQFININLLSKILCNIVIIFTQFLVFFLMLRNQICVVTPVATVLIFDDDLQYHLKQKCTVNQTF